MMATQPARLLPRGSHQQWACPCCGRTLGEVYGGRVVIKTGDRQIAFDAHAPVEQTCPKCATVSAINVIDRAA